MTDPGSARPRVHPDTSIVRRALRRFTLGSGPLRRNSDRCQFLARLLLVCSVALAVPIALAAASSTHDQALVEGLQQSRDRHQVDAELLADPPVVTIASDAVLQPPTRATAAWPGPPGHRHTGLVAVPAGARAGSTVPVWVDRDGELTPEPLDERDAVADAIRMAVGTYLLLTTLAVGVHMVLLAALDRSRLRRWAAEWAATEPGWRGTVG
jgi:hypothetical protein